MAKNRHSRPGFAFLIPLIILVMIVVMIILAGTCAGFVGGRQGANHTGEMITEETTALDEDVDTGPSGGTGACTFKDASKDPPGSNPTRQKVIVPIWKYVRGNKSSGTMALYVHRNCTGAIAKIFNDIYNSPDKPAIKTSDTGCANRRPNNTSRHNWGIACDINWEENFFVSKSGAPLSGGYWKPGDILPDKGYPGWSSGNDILSIPIKSSITTAFSKQNWARGLWRTKNDYMHYSVDGN